MKSLTARWMAPTLGTGILFLTACSLLPTQRQLAPVASTERLSESEQIAGEVMAYLIEVVLGRAGALENRQAWSSRGLNLPLDFDLVSRRMFGPVPLRAELMVLDTNILGLSQVLYRYDRRLNLFKGARDHDSLYPCAELMAIRLFLLQKINRGEKVSIAGMIRHIALFSPESRDAVGAELAAMRLNGQEFRFLKAVFQSEPAFLRYLRHPFIVSTFRKIGVAEADRFTLSADLAATYSQLSCETNRQKKTRPATIAILPAMNPMFDTTSETGHVKPSEDYLKLQEEIKSAILQKIDIINDGPSVADRLDFFTPDHPMTIHPGNADRVIDQLCPDVDFTVILLGKNVYRAIFIDPEADIFPYKNRIYLDVDDVRYQLIDDDIEAIITAIRPTIISSSRTHPTS